MEHMGFAFMLFAEVISVVTDYCKNYVVLDAKFLQFGIDFSNGVIHSPDLCVIQSLDSQ